MKILFITATRLGDAVLSTGLLEYMYQTWPEGKVTVACGKLPKSIFEGFPNVERIMPMTKEPWHRHWFKLWGEIAGTKWDMVVDLRNSAVSRMIIAKKRYIFGKQIDKNAHKVEQAAAVTTLSEVPAPKLYFTAEQQVRADQLIEKGGPVLGIGPSANWPGKMWPQENFIELVNWAISPEGIMPGARAAIFAAPGEEAQAYPVLKAVPEKQQIDVIAKTTPGEAGAALAKCDLYIGNDSGLMHTAAACGVPTFGLFGPSWPHLYRPWGDHTDYISTPEDYAQLTAFEGYAPEKQKTSLMTSLKVEDVKEALGQFWQKQKKAA